MRATDQALPAWATSPEPECCMSAKKRFFSALLSGAKRQESTCWNAVGFLFDAGRSDVVTRAAGCWHDGGWLIGNWHLTGGLPVEAASWWRAVKCHRPGRQPTDATFIRYPTGPR